MADGRLEVQVGANVTELQKKLGSNGTAEKVIDQFAKNGGRSLQSLQSEAKKTGTAFVGFSRILQDAAYGPAAIANNLEGLGHDMAMLRRQSAETGQSIGKTLVQSLMGAGGFNLAIGAATLAMSLASVGLSAWTRLFPDNEKKVKSAKDATEDYIKSLNDVRRASLEGARAAQEDLVNLRVLYQRTQDVTLSMQQRVSASDELQKLYPQYFANLKDEAILAGRAEVAYTKLSVALIATARAEAARSLVAEKQRTILVNQEREADLLRERVELTQKLRQAESLNAATQGQGSQFGTGNIVTGQKVYNIYQDIVENTKEYNALASENNRLQGESLNLYKNINTQIDRGAKLTGSLGAPLEKFKKSIDKSPIQLKIESVGVTSTVSGLEKLKGTLEGLRPVAMDWMSDWQKRTQELSASFSQTLTSGLVDFSSAFIEGIAGLATGAASLSDVGGMLLGIVGDIAIQLGEAAIGIGVGMLAIKAAFANPLTAIAAGVALVAIGGLIKGAASIVQGKGSSGSSSVASPSSGSSSRSTGASYSSSSSGGFNGTVVFEIGGDKLIGVLKNTQAKNLRFS